ncbi:MAG: Arginine--tRNA ligase [Chlamydiales bacterium]|nr:Arginine--tRNA ligase [Chlamydiales bacterium]
MQPLITQIEKELNQAALAAFPELKDLQMHVTEATSDEFGHYQCNSAMKMAKLAKKSPRAIAQTLVENLQTALFEKVEIAGPGFINLTLKAPFLSNNVDQMLRDSHLGIPLPAHPQRIIVEFSSPNIAKEMHVGHLRSTIIGDCIARLFEFLGHDVLRLNHVGDWGTAFGMLIAYMSEEVPQVLEGNQTTDLPALMEWYRASKKRFDEDPEFKTRARKAVIALQSGDSYSLKAWEIICQISRIAFEEVYALLDVKLEERGESYYNPMLFDIVADLEKKGLITLSEGAKCVFHEGLRIPLMVQKSDGGYNYDTTDMAAMLHRVETEKAERIIVVTDAGQNLHFDLVAKTAEKAGYLDRTKVRFDHVPFGVVLGTNGKKYRTRSGETEKLIDLLTTAVDEAQKILEQRSLEMGAEEIKNLAQILGIDAVKYADLSCNRVSDYVFSYERMLRFEGNTAAFILYSYVRVNGIKRKIKNLDLSKLLQAEKIILEHPSEIALGLHLLRFSETLHQMENELLPHALTDYLYLLAQKFNLFFRDCRVEGAPEQNRRLLLCESVARVMAQGLQILGLHVVDRM